MNGRQTDTVPFTFTLVSMCLMDPHLLLITSSSLIVSMGNAVVCLQWLQNRENRHIAEIPPVALRPHNPEKEMSLIWALELFFWTLVWMAVSRSRKKFLSVQLDCCRMMVENTIG